MDNNKKILTFDEQLEIFYKKLYPTNNQELSHFENYGLSDLISKAEKKQDTKRLFEYLLFRKEQEQKKNLLHIKYDNICRKIYVSNKPKIESYWFLNEDRNLSEEEQKILFSSLGQYGVPFLNKLLSDNVIPLEQILNKDRKNLKFNLLEYLLFYFLKIQPNHTRKKATLWNLIIVIKDKFNIDLDYNIFSQNTKPIYIYRKNIKEFNTLYDAKLVKYNISINKKKYDCNMEEAVNWICFELGCKDFINNVISFKNTLSGKPVNSIKQLCLDCMPDKFFATVIKDYLKTKHKNAKLSKNKTKWEEAFLELEFKKIEKNNKIVI